MGAVLGVAPASPAFAHADLEGTVPSSGAVLDEGPDRIVLDFDEPVDVGLGGVELFDQRGESIPLEDPSTKPGDASVVEITGVPDLGDGVYAVVYEVVSADGHPARGAFTFQVGTSASGDAGLLLEQVLAGRDSDPLVGWLLGVGRFLAFAGVVVLVGAALLVAVARPGGFGVRPVRWVAGASWAALAVGTLAVFGLQGPYLVRGSAVDAIDPSLWVDVADTRLGRGLLVRLGLVIVAAVQLWRWRSVRTTWWRASALVVGLGLVLTYSTIGHPSATGGAALSVAIDALHLGAASIWIGGLVVLALGGRSWYADPLVDTDPSGVDQVVEPHPVRRFSRWAAVALAVVVLTGAAQTLRLAGPLGELTDTSWGRVLLVKLAAVVVLVALGGVTRWLLNADGPGSLRRTVVAEALIGVVVLAVTAGLVATPPESTAEAQPFTATVVQAGVLADISVYPAAVGANEIHLVFSPPGGTLAPVLSAEARMVLAGSDLPPVPVDLAVVGPNHWTGVVQLPYAGDWTFEIVAEPEDDVQVLLSTSVPVD
jgi:copper transport protein